MSYNNYNIFNWNENYNGYKNESNLYNNVYIHTGTRKINEWQNVTAVTLRMNLQKLLKI